MKNNENNWIIAIIIVLAVLLFGGFGFGMMGGYGMMPTRDYGMIGAYWTGGYGWMWIFMMLIWVLVIIALILGIMWLVKQLQTPQNTEVKRRARR